MSANQFGKIDMIKVIKKKNVSQVKPKQNTAEIEQEEDLTEVELEFKLASRLWNKGFRE